MQNDYLKDVLIELQNIYVELKSNKDKRMIKKLIVKIQEWLENDNIKCKSVKGKRENAKHFVLDGKLELIENDI